MTRVPERRKVVTSALLKIAESGLLRWFLDRWLPHIPNGSDGPTAFRPAEPANVTAAFCLLAAGWAASVVVFVAERVHESVSREEVGKGVEMATLPELPAEEEGGGRSSVLDGAKSCGDESCPCRLHLTERAQ